MITTAASTATASTAAAAGTPHSISPAARPLRPSDLAAAIARDGIGAHEDAVARLVAASRARDRAPTLTSVLLDRAAPPVARERAFGRIDWLALGAAVRTTPVVARPTAA